jgi:hypothetical protein
MSGTLAAFVKGIEHYKETSPVVGKPLLRFTKQGKWLLGTDAEDATEALVAIDVLHIRLAVVQWSEGQVIRESQPVAMSAGWGAIDRAGFPVDAELTRKMTAPVAFVEQTPKLEALYSTATDGGVRVMEALIDAVHRKALSGSRYIIPGVRLGSDSYKHPSWGIIAKPVLKVERWYDTDGGAEPAPGAKLGKKSMI